MRYKINKKKYEIFDTPWLRKQVESHLVFGLYNAKKKLFWVLVVLFYYFAITWAATNYCEHEIALYLRDIRHLTVVVAIVCFAFFSNYYHAALYWCAAKVSLFFISLSFILGGIINSLQGANGEIYLSLLGIVWFPSIEFLPNALRFQKIITISRLSLSVLLIRTISTG